MAAFLSAHQWWIGDWWAFAEKREAGKNWSGDRKATVEAEGWTGPSFGTCMNAGTVCRTFNTSRRHEVLSFEHHKILTTLPPEQADALLDWCEAPLKNGRKKARSIRELRTMCAAVLSSSA